MVRATKGVLVECDASIKAIIMKLNSDRHDYVIEDLDDEHVIVHDNKLADLKKKLNEMLNETFTDPRVEAEEADMDW